jgi:hypothetical protein
MASDSKVKETSRSCLKSFGGEKKLYALPSPGQVRSDHLDTFGSTVNSTSPGKIKMPGSRCEAQDNDKPGSVFPFPCP